MEFLIILLWVIERGDTSVRPSNYAKIYSRETELIIDKLYGDKF